MTDNPFDKPAGKPSLSFATRDEHGNLGSVPVGTRLGGKVISAPRVVQSVVYEGPEKGRPEFWGDGGKKTTAPKNAAGQDNKPVSQIVVEVRTPQGDERSLWVPYYPKAMFEAIQTALAGRAIEVGDDLFVTLTGFTPVPGKNPAKDYSADFVKGQGAFSAEAATKTVEAPPAPPAAAAPPPPPAPPAPAWAGQAERDAFLAAGWSPEQIAEHHPHLVPPVAAAPAAPPAPPAAPATDARAAALAAMSPEDRALLGLA